MRKKTPAQIVVERRIVRAARNARMLAAQPNDLYDAAALGEWVGLYPDEISRAKREGRKIADLLSKF